MLDFFQLFLVQLEIMMWKSDGTLRMNRESHILREKHGSAGGQTIIANGNPGSAMMSMMRDANGRAG
jgi:hypothetical protein